jgi:hypothetical protein
MNGQGDLFFFWALLAATVAPPTGLAGVGGWPFRPGRSEDFPATGGSVSEVPCIGTPASFQACLKAVVIAVTSG